MRPTRGHLIALTVALLVVFAGCGGAGDGGDGATATTAPGTDAPTTGGDGGDTGATTTAGGGGATTAAPTTGAPGTTTGGGGSTAFLSDHVASVRSVGSYAATYTINLSGGQANAVSMTGTIRADLESGAQFQRFSSGTGQYSSTTELYRAAGSDSVVWCMQPSGDSCMSRQEYSDGEAQGQYNMTSPIVADADAAGSASYTDEGLVSTADGERRRYVVRNAEDLGGEMDGSAVVSAEIVVLVNPDTGYITEFRYDVTTEDGEGNQMETEFTIEYTQFGDVTVAEPGWY